MGREHSNREQRIRKENYVTAGRTGGCKIIEAEEVESYNALFGAEKCDIAQKNTCDRNVFSEFPVG